MFPVETGGVLMGYWVKEFEEIVITHAIGPGPTAIHLPTGFIPDSEYQEDEIACHYAESERLSTYLGDWHTHPLETAHLSRKDRRTLRRIAKYTDARASVPLMVVLGGGDPWCMKIWRFSPWHLGTVTFGCGVVPLDLQLY
jgi:integrative and conjugative element protein (TIGR02256 family)